MELIGDLERLIATNLYPLRVPLASAGVVAVLLFAWFARRRGRLDAFRRHPVRSGAVAFVAIGVLAPLTWYLASPLFIRVELDEPAPVVAAAEPSASPSPTVTSTPSSAPTAEPTGSAPTQPPTPAPTPAPTPTPIQLSGRFHGADDFHFGRGTARLIEVEPGRHVVRFEGFAVRNGPDLYVYLSPDADGYAKGVVELGRLRATDGSFNTRIPEGTDLGKVRSVVIWCKQFSVLFAVARLDG
jgi:hypothetical protein